MALFFDTIIKIITFIWALFALFLLPTSSFAQSQRNPCYYTSTPGASGNTGCIPVSTSNPLPVTGGGGGGGGAVFGPTAAGTAASNPPILEGGTSDGTATGTVKNTTVKSASTAAVATDTSEVVQLNPLSPGIIAAAIPGTPNTTQVLSIQGETGMTPVTVQTSDPCTSALKQSVPINITSATTTSLVGVSGSTTVYVCGLALTISEVVTTPNTILFEYGTGATCTSPTALTGIFGGGGVTAGDPIPVVYGNGGSTVFRSTASNGVCALTAIGASGSFQGVLTYVQQ